MSTYASDFEKLLLHRSTPGVLLIALLVLVVAANRPMFREVWNDPSAFWRATCRAGVASLTVTLLWITTVDDLYQLVSEPLRRSFKWEYQRVVFAPIDPEYRSITVGMVVLTALLLGALFARHVGGYGLQVGLLVLSAITWAPLYILGQRLNVMVIQGIDDSRTTAETAGVTAFWLVRSGLGLGLVLVTLLGIVMLAALIVTPLLDLLRLRHPRATHEADGFFSELGTRADHYDDLPLKAYWRPIERPN